MDTRAIFMALSQHFLFFLFRNNYQTILFSVFSNIKQLFFFEDKFLSRPSDAASLTRQCGRVVLACALIVRDLFKMKVTVFPTTDHRDPKWS